MIRLLVSFVLAVISTFINGVGIGFSNFVWILILTTINYFFLKRFKALNKPYSFTNSIVLIAILFTIDLFIVFATLKLHDFLESGLSD